MNNSARFSFDDQGKRRFVGAPSGAMSMDQFMPDLPMSSQRPVRTFADGGSVSNQQINEYIQGVLSSGVSQQEAANQINAAAAQYGVSRDQIAGATGYGLDLVNQYLGAPASSPAAASPATSFAAASPASSPVASSPVASSSAPSSQAINDYIQGVLSSGVSQQEAANQINAAAAQTGVSRDQIANATGYGLDLVNQYLGPLQTPTLTNAASTAAPAVSAASTAAPAVTPQQRQSNFEQGVRDWFAANPNATVDQVNKVIAGIDKASYNPFTKTFGLDGMTYKYDAAPGYSQQQFQSVVDQYLGSNPSLTYQQVQDQAQKLGLDYNPYTGKVTYGDLTYTAPKGPRVSQEEFQRIVDDYFRKNPNVTGEEAARVAASIGGEYNPFTQTVTAGNLSYKTALGAGATFNQFQSLVDKYLSEGKKLTGEDVARDAKSIGADYNPFTKTVTYKGYTYNATNAPGPTFNQFKGVVTNWLGANPNASAVDTYLAARSANFDYDPFTKQVTFGSLTYSPPGIKGYLNTPDPSVFIDADMVSQYAVQATELSALAAKNNQLQPLAIRAKAIYDEVLARFNKPPTLNPIELPSIINDSRSVFRLPGITAPDANFRRTPPRVWNNLLGAFTYAPAASVSAPNPNQLPGAVAQGQGESWTPPVVTSRPRSLLNVRQNTINPRTGLPEYAAGYDKETGIFTAPVSRSIQASSDRSRGFAGLNAAMAGKRYTTPEYYSFLANVRGGAYGNPTDPDFPSRVKAAVDAYYASKPVITNTVTGNDTVTGDTGNDTVAVVDQTTGVG